ncbi:MAG: tetratricopeptide repeat protein [Myxococcales bacterium]|nr:tetratricopeptide repeat protein [Myxococcales bacterium]
MTPRPAIRRPAAWPSPLPVACAALGLAAAVAWCGAFDARADGAEPTAAARERFVRQRIEDARAFRRQGRLEAAERAVRRGLAVQPDSAELHRALARVLEATGRSDEAEAQWSRADALDPPPPPPPETPLGVPASDLLVVLLAPEPGRAQAARSARDWPEGGVAAELERRLRVRLPDATVVHASADSVAAARSWIAGFAPRAALSLRVDRSYCGDTQKDGPFALAWLRVAAAAAGNPVGEPRQVREVVAYPRPWSRCESLAVAGALERALALPDVRTAISAAPEPGTTWSAAAVRALFPELGRRLAAELEAGRLRLSHGELAGAEADFRRAARIDPEDPEVRVYLAEIDATLAMAKALDAPGGEPAARLDPRLSAAAHGALEARLDEERRRREDLLAALAVLDEDVEPPPPSVLAALRPVDLGDPQAFGPAQAGARADGIVEARAAYAPDGALLARYYFVNAAESPVLREDDSSGDGRPDRWTAYERRTRSEIWEDRRAAGRPNVHLVFAPGGEAVVRIEYLASEAERVERVSHYDAGTLVSEEYDTDGDGVLDRFDRFDAEGRLEVRAEDLDGDGRIDLRSVYRDGKLVRREVASPDFMPDDTSPAPAGTVPADG